MLLRTSSLLVLVVAMLVVTNIFSSNIQYSFADESGNDSSDRCNCVIFRLDDIQDGWLVEQQQKILNLFLERNQSLSVGIIVGSVGEDSSPLDLINEGAKRGLFELALHGWSHIDHSKLSEQEQVDRFLKSNNKLRDMSGSTTDIFFAPYNKFNNATIEAMKQTGIRIISADRYEDHGPYFVSPENQANEGQTIYRLPESVSFRFIGDGGTWVDTPVPTILEGIKQSISQYGYAVVTLHPQDLARIDEDGTLTQELDTHEASDLNLLVDTLMSEKVPFKTFSEVTHMEMKQYDFDSYISKKNEEHERGQLLSLSGLVILPVVGMISAGVMTFWNGKKKHFSKNASSRR